jgi:phosphatidylglycerophosphate synthase
MADKAEFGGAEKVGKSILHRPERWMVNKLVPKIPKRVETYHLTLMTLVWSILIVVFAYLAQGDLRWLWGISVMIVFQFITDVFDGAVGRYRDTGLVKWGFHMDHFLDYIFLCAMLSAYYLIAPDGLEEWFFLLFVVAVGFVVNSYLYFAATNEFQIYYYRLGPTEARIFFILLNTSVIYTGTGHFKYSIPIICVIFLGAVTFLVYKTQKKLWFIDMKAKARRLKNAARPAKSAGVG